MKLARLLSKAGIALLALLMLLVPSSAAHAVRLPQTPPLDSLSGQVEDLGGFITDHRADLDTAIANFDQGTGYRFYIVTVESFDGISGRDWADETAANAGLGARDILLAISPNDLDYGISPGPGVTLSRAQQDALVDITDNSLNAALTGAATWGEGLTNVVNAFHNELAPAAAAPEQQPEPGTGIDGPEGETLIEGEATGGGMPWWGILLIVLGALIALFVLWLLLGKYNEKRLAKKRDNFTLV